MGLVPPLPWYAISLDNLHQATLSKIMTDYKKSLQFLVLRASHVVTMSKAAFAGGRGGQNDFAKQKMDETVERFRKVLSFQTGPSVPANGHPSQSRGNTVVSFVLK